MAQPAPLYRPQTHELEALTSPPSPSLGHHARLLRARHRLLVRWTTTILCFAGVAIVYLCCLVRVSRIDVACQESIGQYRMKEAVIGVKRTELASMVEATALERFADENGYVPPTADEPVQVSAELCTPDPPPDLVAQSLAPPSLHPWVKTGVVGLR